MQAPRITAWVAGLGLVLPSLCLAASRDAAIAANVAPLFVGEEKIVEGTVTAAEREGSVVYLRFGSAPHSLTVSLVIGLLSNFPSEPERYYLGKAVRVVGLIRTFRDRPEIVIHDPADITLVDALPPAVSERAAVAVPARDEAAALREQVKTLNERVRMLEDQVEKLQGGSK
jgi:DNA/RNA endonuclease YhcR with UshA esterase domain